MLLLLLLLVEVIVVLVAAPVVTLVVMLVIALVVVVVVEIQYDEKNSSLYVCYKQFSRHNNLYLETQRANNVLICSLAQNGMEIGI